MSQTAFLLILASVVLHAGWHFLSKKSDPHYTFFIVMSTALSLTMLPLLIASRFWQVEIPGKLWGCILGGGICGGVYVLGLSYAYRFAEISQAYPLSRALPVLLTAAITTIFGFGKELSSLAIAGMVVIFVGCVLMPLRSLRHFRIDAYLNKGMLGILASVVGSTAYTIIDSTGVKMMSELTGGLLYGAGAYSCLREVVILLAVLIATCCQKSERQQLSWSIYRRPMPYFSGFFAGIAYLLVLIAIGHVTNVSYVQAFRQMSLPIGIFLGVMILKERVTKFQFGAMAMVLTGLVIVYLG